jgi:hypothetical protein
MSVQLFMDVHVQRAIAIGLRYKGVNVWTAQEDGSDQLPDPELLQRATDLGRILFSMDRDLLVEACHRQRASIFFSGLVYCHQLRLTVGQIIADLELIAKIFDSADMENQVQYLPLQ